MTIALSERAKIALSTFFLFCFALFLTDYSAKHPGTASVAEAVVAEAARPVQLLHRGLQNQLLGLWDGYLFLVHLREENEQLKQRLSVLESKNAALSEFRSENQRLRGLLNIKEQTALDGVVANVIAYDPSKWVRAIVIDKGRSDKITPGMAVMDGNGIVGQVVAASAKTSRVLLISDHSSGVDVILQRNRARGVIEGSGGSFCQLHYVLREEEVRIGDPIITSGLDGVYPKGILVGVVSDLNQSSSGLFHEIEVKPAVDFSNLETVLIVTSEIPATDEKVQPRVPGRTGRG